MDVQQDGDGGEHLLCRVARLAQDEQRPEGGGVESAVLCRTGCWPSAGTESTRCADAKTSCAIRVLPAAALMPAVRQVSCLTLTHRFPTSIRTCEQAWCTSRHAIRAVADRTVGVSSDAAFDIAPPVRASRAAAGGRCAFHVVALRWMAGRKIALFGGMVGLTPEISSTPLNREADVSCNTCLDRPDLGLLLLRLGAGGVLAAHGAQKLFGWFGGGGLEQTGAAMEAMGYVPGKQSAAAAGLSELGGGALLALGLATPAAGAAAAGDRKSVV